jgi:hypothetical protein
MIVNLALKAKYAFYSTLVFFLVANPETFKMTDRVFGWLFTIADIGGCPTATGFFFHTAIFFFVLWGIMLFPRETSPVPDDHHT